MGIGQAQYVKHFISPDSDIAKGLIFACHYIFKDKVGLSKNDIVVIRIIICSSITIDQTRDVAWIKNLLFDIF